VLELGSLVLEDVNMLLFDSQFNMEKCIIKVSCDTVHSSVVGKNEIWRALRVLHSQGSPGLKTEIALVLKACAYVAGRCLVIVMANLSHPSKKRTRHKQLEERSTVVSPITCRSRLLLWEAFSTLVTNILLPMACIDIIHADIRFDPQTWSVCNLLEVTKDDESIELRLIDFESLVPLNYGNLDLPTQDYAISLGGRRPSAHEFLFWQVLWMAYVWSPTTDKFNLVTSTNFMEDFYSDTEGVFEGFKTWIGNNELTSNKNPKSGEATVTAALKTLGNAFTQQADGAKKIEDKICGVIV
jgi:hypothetical protein